MYSTTTWGMVIFCLSILFQTNLSAQKLWTGAVDNDWHNANNWDPVGVPTTSDRLDLFVSPNDPVIKSNQNAVAKYIQLDEDVSLTIEDDAILRIDNQDFSNGVNSYGTLHNYGILLISNTLQHGYNNSGDGEFHNYDGGLVSIGHYSSIGGIGLRNVGHFYNHEGGMINIGIQHSIAEQGVANYYKFVNEGLIRINRTGGEPLFNDTSQDFTNEKTGEIEVNHLGISSPGDGLSNNGLFVNLGSLSIDYIDGFGLYHQSGTFVNQINAKLQIGQNGPIGVNGILATSFFFNYGEMSLNNIGRDAINIPNTGSMSFGSQSLVNIGTDGPISEEGIENGGSFYNNGELNIDDIGGEAFKNRPTGKARNDANGQITLGETGPLLKNGIDNQGEFDNKGALYISNVKLDAINNVVDGEFENFDGASIKIAFHGTIEGSGIQFDKLFINQQGATIEIGGHFPVFDKGISGTGEFTNHGLIRYNASNTLGLLLHQNGKFLNGPSGVFNLGNQINSSVRGIFSFGTITNEGIITIDRTTGPGLVISEGDFFNKSGAALHIGANGEIGGDGLQVKSYFKSTGGLMTINATAGHAIKVENNGAFETLLNSETYVGNSGPVSGAGVALLGEWNNNSEFFIDKSADDAIGTAPTGILHNLPQGKITVGLFGSITSKGISNTGEVYNEGTINVDQTIGGGIYNHTAADFQNKQGASLKIGANHPIGNNGVENKGTFFNEGTMFVDQTNNDGIRNVDGEFHNKADGSMTMGSLFALGGNGVDNTALFKNYGFLAIVNSQQDGISTTGTGNKFENFPGGHIEIGVGGNIDSDGFWTSSSVVNQGYLKIENTSIKKLMVNSDGSVRNFGRIELGPVASSFHAALRIDGSFFNAECGELYLEDYFNNNGSFENHGFVDLNTDEDCMANTSTLNYGLFNNRFGVDIPNYQNIRATVTPLQGECVISDAIQIASNHPFDFEQNWRDVNTNETKGTYDLNTNSLTLVNDLPPGIHHLVFETTHLGAGCTYEVFVTVNYQPSTPPTVQCMNAQIELDANGMAALEVADVLSSYVLNCTGNVEFSLSQTDFTCADLGTNTVTLTIDDGLGNTADCTAEVEVTAPDGDSDGFNLCEDCNDADASVHPGATELCDGVDNNCDGVVDEVCCTLEITNLELTHESCPGAADGMIEISTNGTGQVFYSIDGGANFSLSGTFENLSPGFYHIVVNEHPNNCWDDAMVEIVAASPSALQNWYKDTDGDGYSDGMSITACSQPAGYYLAGDLLSTNGDCNDNAPNEYPGQTWYEDLDSDGHSSGNWLNACLRPAGCFTAAGLVGTSGDCNDNDENTYPGATETCNGIDDDCDGQIDEGITGAVFNGNVSFYTQAEVDAFASCFSVINGSVMIYGTSITNLSNLGNWTEITGGLTIYFTGLTNLDGLEQLADVGQQLMIYYNFNLANCCAIHDLINGGVGGSIMVYLNATGCNSTAEINSNCAPSPLITNPTNTIVGTTWERHPTTSRERISDDLKIYPNPATNQFFVEMKNETAPKKIDLYDLQGQLVKQQTLSGSTGRHAINVSNLKTGTYFVYVHTDRSMEVQRLVVMR